MMQYETTIYGKYAQVVVYTDGLDQASRQQIQQMADSPLFEGCQVRIMPDVHAGKGSVIGFTSTLSDKVCCNIVGVDIGCGVTLDKIDAKRGINFQVLDKTIREQIPSGFSVRKGIYKPLLNSHSKLGSLYAEIKDDLQEASRRIGIDPDRVVNSIGTLGGGNHLIEIDALLEGTPHLMIHSGSRGFGAKVAEHHQAKAYSLHDRGFYPKGTPKVLSWLEGGLCVEYSKDMVLAQKYAILNRAAMAHAIECAMGWDLSDHIESIHNFIDYDAGYIRKGAISAQKGEDLLIPISMAEGVIIGKGRGNPHWNYSAPHGAGRLLSRGEAKRQLTMEEFRARMGGVWSSCVSTSTLDESPMAYKGATYILERIVAAVDVLSVAMPVYNFKASE